MQFMVGYIFIVFGVRCKHIDELMHACASLGIGIMPFTSNTGRRVLAVRQTGRGQRTDRCKVVSKSDLIHAKCMMWWSIWERRTSDTDVQTRLGRPSRRAYHHKSLKLDTGVFMIATAQFCSFSWNWSSWFVVSSQSFSSQKIFFDLKMIGRAKCCLWRRAHKRMAEHVSICIDLLWN